MQVKVLIILLLICLQVSYTFGARQKKFAQRAQHSHSLSADLGSVEDALSSIAPVINQSYDFEYEDSFLDDADASSELLEKYSNFSEDDSISQIFSDNPNLDQVPESQFISTFKKSIPPKRKGLHRRQSQMNSQINSSLEEENNLEVSQQQKESDALNNKSSKAVFTQRRSNRRGGDQSEFDNNNGYAKSQMPDESKEEEKCDDTSEDKQKISFDNGNKKCKEDPKKTDKNYDNTTEKKENIIGLNQNIDTIGDSILNLDDNLNALNTGQGSESQFISTFKKSIPPKRKGLHRRQSQLNSQINSSSEQENNLEVSQQQKESDSLNNKSSKAVFTQRRSKRRGGDQSEFDNNNGYAKSQMADESKEEKCDDKTSEDKKSQEISFDDENKNCKNQKEDKKKSDKKEPNKTEKKEDVIGLSQNTDTIGDSILNLDDNVSQGFLDALNAGQGSESQFISTFKKTVPPKRKGLHRGDSQNLPIQKTQSSSKNYIEKRLNKIGENDNTKQNEIVIQNDKKDENEGFMDKIEPIIDFVFQKDENYEKKIEKELSSNELLQKIQEKESMKKDDNLIDQQANATGQGISSDMGTFVDQLSEGLSDLGDRIVHPSQILEDAEQLEEETLQAPQDTLIQSENAVEQISEITDGSAESLANAPLDTINNTADYIIETTSDSKKEEVKNQSKSQNNKKFLAKKNHKKACKCDVDETDDASGEQKKKDCGCGGGGSSNPNPRP